MERALPWSETFNIGHPQLDAQHRRLVDLINEIGAAIRAKKKAERVASLLKVFRLSAQEHFRQEDAILWELKTGTYKPPQGQALPSHVLGAMAEAVFDGHMAEHASLLDRFDAIVAAPAETLCETLKAWFLDHVIKQDSHLKTIFQAM